MTHNKKSSQDIADIILPVLNGEEKRHFYDTLEKDNINLNAYQRLIRLLRRSGALEEAFRLLLRMEEANPLDTQWRAEVFYLRSTLFFKGLGYDDALTNINEAYALNKNSVKSLLLRSKIQGKRKDFSAAMKDLDLAIAIDGQTPYLMLQKVAIYIDTEQYYDAQKLNECLLEDNKESGLACYYAARLAFINHDYQEAFYFLKEAEVEGNNALQVSALRAEIFLALKQYGKAIKILHHLLKEDPADATLLDLLAKNYLESRDYIHAQIVLEHCCTLFPCELAFFSQLAFCYLSKREYIQAEELLNKNLSVDAEHIDSIQVKYELAKINERDDEALTWVQRLYALDPSEKCLLEVAYLAKKQQSGYAVTWFERGYYEYGNKEALLEACYLFFKTKQYKKVFDALSLLLEKTPDDIRLYLLQAKTYVAVKKINDAILVINKAMYLAPENEEAILYKVSLERNLGHYEEAQALLVKYHFILKKNAHAYYEAYLISMQLGDTDNAFSQILLAIKLDADNEVYRLALAHFYYKKALYDEFLVEIEKSRELAPKSAIIYACRAFVYSIKKEYVKALEDFDLALEFGKDSSIYTDLLVGKAICLIEQKKYDAARELLLTATQISPTNIKVIYYHALVLEKQKQWNKALEVCDFYLKLTNEGAMIWRKRAEILMRIKQIKRAVNSLNHAIEEEPNNAFHYYLRACCFLKLSYLSRAGKDFYRAFHLFPRFKRYQHHSAVHDFLSA